MRSMQCRLVAAVALLVAGFAPAQADLPRAIRPAVAAASYFPLGGGNHWLYARTGTSGDTTWEVSVADPGATRPQRLYDTLLGYFPGPRQVRVDTADSVLEWSGLGQLEHLWYPFDAPVGTRWSLQLAQSPLASPLPDCASGSKLVLASRDEVLQVPAGEFRNVIRVDWTSPCADAGITSEWFAPGVGLIRRDETSLAGPVVSALLRADLGPSGLPSGAYAVTLGLESSQFGSASAPVSPAGPATARGFLELRNSSQPPVELTFSGCKSVSVEVLDGTGAVVAAGRGDDGGCCACLNILTVSLHGGAITVPFSLPLATPSGAPLPGGSYSLRATLDTVGDSSLRPTATAPIRILSTP